MRILLTLSLLLAFIGDSLARNVTVTSRNCVKGKCVECINGVCRELVDRRRESSEQTTSSSRDCVSNNGHETCIVCVNGNCHTTTTGKREASEDNQNNNSASSENNINISKRDSDYSYYAHNCTHFENRTRFEQTCNSIGCWRYLNYDGEFSHRPNCTFLTYEELRYHNKREASEEEQNNNNAESVNNIIIDKRESYFVHNCTHFVNGTQFGGRCSSRGCIGYRAFSTNPNCTLNYYERQDNQSENNGDASNPADHGVVPE